MMKLKVVSLGEARRLVQDLHKGSAVAPFAIISVGEVLGEKPPSHVQHLSGYHTEALSLVDTLVAAGANAESELVFHCQMGEVRSVRAAAAVGLVLAWRLNPDINLRKAQDEISQILLTQGKGFGPISDGLTSARNIIRAAPKPKRARMPRISLFAAKRRPR